ncbi:DUF2716 domain-containing protein [Rhodococcus oryzae]|uniref:DUF2716 domain-containing protein n=1 Tax=Rhodococcus oryzae TaxID=2571143 RepID=UPI0037916775
MRYTLDFGNPLPPGWAELTEDDRHRHWTAFTDRVGGFRPGVTPVSWPAIAEPTPSVTFDLTNAGGTPASWSAGLVATLGRTLATWLPRKRINGQQCQ